MKLGLEELNENETLFTYLLKTKPKDNALITPLPTS